ncbi:MAG: phosphoribosyltransferase [Pseudonocardia sp.]|nr:phosphoribosyltransferase [Pseudonocardia sp.]MDT7618016.1 adenine phosphoribosyltransferase [Pseudonocardiales bacterium]
MRRCPSSGQWAQRALIIACSEHRVLQVERAQAREAVAVALGVGFVAVRKPATLFPGPTINVRAGADHRGQQHLQRVPAARDRVPLVDEWAERGSQARAAR